MAHQQLYMCALAVAPMLQILFCSGKGVVGANRSQTAPPEARLRSALPPFCQLAIPIGIYYRKTALSTLPSAVGASSMPSTWMGPRVPEMWMHRYFHMTFKHFNLLISNRFLRTLTYSKPSYLLVGRRGQHHDLVL